MSLQTQDNGGLGYSFLPAAGHHFLTPWFDSVSALLGLGRGFKTKVVEAAGIVDGARVLDLACGTGRTALLVKQRYPRCAVTGLDVDPNILKIAGRHMGKAGVSGIDLVCAPAEKTGLEGASFDVVISTLAFHHLPPRSKEDAAGEVARLLRVGGAFLLVDLQPLTNTLRALRQERATSPRWGFRTNTAEKLRQVLTGAGLEVQDVDPPRTWAFRPWMFALRGTRLR
jgi:ubiquinone/menaquinone biosynthesis C-methylase UbiE